MSFLLLLPAVTFAGYAIWESFWGLSALEPGWADHYHVD